MPTITIDDVYKELKRMGKEMLTKRDLDSFAETIDIVSNPHLISTLKRSEEDIKKGKVKKINSVKDLL